VDPAATNPPAVAAPVATTARRGPIPVPELPVDQWAARPASPPPTRPAGPTPERHGPPPRRQGRWALEWVAVLVVALVLAVGVRAYLVQMFYIPSGSMLPTLQVGERIVVDKVGYRIDGIHRGDIVVFRRPAGDTAPYADLVKRVIGLPGETIGTADGRVTIDGRPLAEPWLPAPPPPTLPSPLAVPYSLSRPYLVPAGEYFVMGDNRTDSEDSRYFGPIPAGLIVGRMTFKAWPLSPAAWAVVVVVVLAVILAVALVGLRGARRPGRHSAAAGRASPAVGRG
jgi:signal peptidase I